MENKKNKEGWITGGTTLIGTGIGFVFLSRSPFLFVACILIGIGLGLIMEPLIKIKK